MDDEEDLKLCESCVFWHPDPPPPGAEPASGRCGRVLQPSVPPGVPDEPAYPARWAVVDAEQTPVGEVVLRTGAGFGCVLHDESPDPLVALTMAPDDGVDLLAYRAVRDAAVPLLRGSALRLSASMIPGFTVDVDDDDDGRRPVNMYLNVANDASWQAHRGFGDLHAESDRPYLWLHVTLEAAWLDEVHRQGWAVLDGRFVLQVLDHDPAGRPATVTVLHLVPAGPGTGVTELQFRSTAAAVTWQDGGPDDNPVAVLDLPWPAPAG